MATSNGGILGTIESTVSTSSVEREIDDEAGSVEGDVKNDVENEASDIAQKVQIPSVLPTSTVTDAVGNLEDLLNGNETTADGTVIPKEAMVNTALIIFGDFAATFIAYAITTNYIVFGKQFLHYDSDEMERTNLIVIGIDAGFYLLTGCMTDWYHGYTTAMRIYWLICFIGTSILPFLTFDWSVFGRTYGISIPIRRIFFYAARIVTGFGVCGIQATSPPYAARQIEKYGSTSVQSCFHYIYMAVQCAPLLALTGLSFVQLNVSFFCGYLSTSGVIILTVLLFKYARGAFRQSTPDKGKTATTILTSAANEIKSKLAPCCSYCNCSCCPNLSSSVDEESMQLLCDCTPKSTSMTTYGAGAQETSSKLPTTATSSDNSSKVRSSTTDTATSTATNYGSTEATGMKLSTTSSGNASKSKYSTTNAANSTTTNGSTDLSVAKISITTETSEETSKDKSSTTDPKTTTTSYETIELTVAKVSTTADPSGNASKNDPSTATDENSDLTECIEDLPESVRHCLWVCYAMLLLSCQVPYSIMRYQISTSYVSQAIRMKPSILGQNISPSLLQQCLPLVSIALAPIVNAYIYPYISTRFTALTMPNRTMVGIALATLSVFCAAIVETARMMLIERGYSFTHDINNQTIVASDLTLDALIPQYVLMGAADVFIFITSLEFAFKQSPCTMQAIATGIFLFYEAIGRSVALILVPLINTITAADPWYPHEINDGHLNYYFLVLTAISLTNLIVYSVMEKGYEEVDQYLCPDEETFGGGDDEGGATGAGTTGGGGGGTANGSSIHATATVDTPVSPNPRAAPTQAVASTTV